MFTGRPTETLTAWKRRRHSSILTGPCERSLTTLSLFFFLSFLFDVGSNPLSAFNQGVYIKPHTPLSSFTFPICHSERKSEKSKSNAVVRHTLARECVANCALDCGPVPQLSFFIVSVRTVISARNALITEEKKLHINHLVII